MMEHYNPQEDIYIYMFKTCRINWYAVHLVMLEIGVHV